MIIHTQRRTEEEMPHYYAIIPGSVRYCENLEMGAKMLYGEISALTRGIGCCEPSAQYFADLYDVKVSKIIKWIEDLMENEFIFVEDKKIFLTA